MTATRRARSQNPFMLMLDPQAVLEAIEHSERLEQLNSHICRPLDRVTVPGNRRDDGLKEFDEDIDSDQAVAASGGSSSDDIAN